MTKVIRKNISKEALQAIMKTLKPKRSFNASKHCEVLRLSQSPLSIQQGMRDEWD